jgi:hypothetical protein
MDVLPPAAVALRAVGDNGKIVMEHDYPEHPEVMQHAKYSGWKLPAAGAGRSTEVGTTI